MKLDLADRCQWAQGSEFPPTEPTAADRLRITQLLKGSTDG